MGVKIRSKAGGFNLQYKHIFIPFIASCVLVCSVTLAVYNLQKRRTVPRFNCCGCSADCIRVTLDFNLNLGLTHVVTFLSPFRLPFTINDHAHFPNNSVNLGWYNLQN